MINRIRITHYFKDIRFWILSFFLLRLIGISNAPLEISHSWRQCLTNMIARNYVDGHANLLYPKIDMAGNLSGIIGSEFPFYNYIIYLVSLPFGYEHWYGRLINLIISSIGVYYFFLLLREICNKKIAMSATFVLLSSLWFAFSRKIMPDTFSVSLVIIGLYYCYSFIQTGKNWKLILYFILVTLGMLCKIPALSLISVIAVLVIIREIELSRKLKVFFVATLSVGIVGLWYFYWVPHLLDTFHYQLYFPKGLVEGFNEITPLLPEFFEKFYFSSLCSYFALPFLLVGIYFLIRKHHLYLKVGILIMTLTFLFFILKTGAVFPTHNYYIIPFTPVMALLVGIGLNKVPKKYLFIPLFLIVTEGIMNQQHDFFIKETEKYKLTLENFTHKYVKKDELIVINGGESPQVIYFAHRKGWTIVNEKINKKDLRKFYQKGASYLIIDKNKYPEEVENYKLLGSDVNFAIYKLR